MTDKLGVCPDALEAEQLPQSVRRMVDPRSKIQQEFIVMYNSPPVRDAVKSSGYKLEGQRAGIRIEVPTFL